MSTEFQGKKILIYFYFVSGGIQGLSRNVISINVKN